MARIPEEAIERVKRETDLVALVRSRGIELIRHGSKDFAGRCPFHEEGEGSFIVTPDLGLFHCMGCGAAGNAIQFVQRFDGVSFRHAYELLSEGEPAFSSASGTVRKCSTVSRLTPLASSDAGDSELLSVVTDYYHERLLKTDAARDYLKGRGLYLDEAIERFKLGFADRTLGLRLPDKNRKDGAAQRSHLTRLGLLRQSGHEHFTGSITLPILTETGDVGEIYGRKITANLSKGTPLHLYLPGPHRGVWNLEAFGSPEIVLCEAPFDGLTFWVNGIQNVTFIFGTEGFTEDLMNALLSHRVRRIQLAYDADEAGNRAAVRDAARLAAHGIECFRVKFPWGMDANEYARKAEAPARALETALQAAESMGLVPGKPAPHASPPVDSPPRPDPASTPAEAPSPAPALHSFSLAAKGLAAEEVTSQKVQVAPKKCGTSEALYAMHTGHESNHSSTQHSGRSKKRAGRSTAGDHHPAGRAHSGTQG